MSALWRGKFDEPSRFCQLLSARAVKIPSTTCPRCAHCRSGIVAVQVMNYELGKESARLIYQIGAGVEIFVFVAFLTFFATFVPEFKTYSLDFQIVRRRDSGQSETLSASSSSSDFSIRR